MHDLLYLAVLDGDGGELLDKIPFHALSDVDAREAGRSMWERLPGCLLGLRRVRVLDLVVGCWDGASFSTGSPRELFDSNGIDGAV